MSVFKRKTSKGETAEYHYKFMLGGKCHYGVCVDCTTERNAQAYEKQIQGKLKELQKQKSVKALVENFRDDLTGGKPLALDSAFDEYIRQPARRTASAKQISRNRTYWNDFVSFMKDKYPDVISLTNITDIHANEYIHLLRESGAYDKTVSFSGSTKKPISYQRKEQKLSGRTLNARHKAIKAIFARLSVVCGLIRNPFDLHTLDNKSSSREIFTQEELKAIGDNMTMPYIKPIFMIGLFTGLTLGDICLLKWSEVVNNRVIDKTRRKTGVPVEIPILPPLASFLEEQHRGSKGYEYVSPELAAMYLENPSGVHYRIKKFLESLDIQTSKRHGTRSRATVSKGAHSLRHTFAYMAGVYQVPLPIVQSILGHMTPEMTKHYQSHANRKEKELALKALPNLLQVTSMRKLESIHQKLHELIDTLTAKEVSEITDIIITKYRPEVK